jgi:bifunctional non-homologous end joining protein LigD
MLATLMGSPFNNQDWYFEVKWDGIRALSILNRSDKIDIQSRNGNKIAKRFPEIVESLEEIKKANNLKNITVLDGEIVVLDNKGFPNFQSLQKRININSNKFIESLSRQFPATYYIFDILYHDGKDLKNLPLVERRQILENFISRSNKKRIRVSRFIDGEGKDIFHSIKKMNLEGMIAKHKQSRYYLNTRSSEWLKIKNAKTQDCIIIGYTNGQGNREGYFGSLLLAAKFTNLKEFDNNNLKFIGHCGSGFNFKQIIKIYQQLEKIKTEKCSVNDIPYVNRESTWVKPVFVVEVKFNGWTDDMIMRSPIFLRCRVDKPPN